MSFRAHLESVCGQVEGAVACSLMAFDGIAVETHEVKQQGLDLQAVLVEFSNILVQIRNAAEILATGDVSEVSINTEKLVTIARLVTKEYFMVLAMLPEGNYGKGRYALRIAVPKVRAEL
jgi:predicted regulator of Ras-like GTPase activity (Roadblock/LC7/MglB family)